jgi:hypothetical protein
MPQSCHAGIGISIGKIYTLSNTNMHESFWIDIPEWSYHSFEMLSLILKSYDKRQNHACSTLKINTNGSNQV